MNSHSNTKTNAYGDLVSKHTYAVGDLVATYISETRMYHHGIVIEIDERNWVSEDKFKNVYTIFIQDNGMLGGKTVERYTPDIYLPHMKQILNEELLQIRTSKGYPLIHKP